LHLQDRNIEGTTTKIVDSNDGVVCAIETISQGSGRRLVDYSENLKASNLTGILGRLPLRIIEVCRNGDDSMAADWKLSICSWHEGNEGINLLDLLVQVLLSSLPHFDEDH